MPSKRKPVKKAPKGRQLMQMPIARPWYHAPLRTGEWLGESARDFPAATQAGSSTEKTATPTP
jgi:hypothetical protein